MPTTQEAALNSPAESQAGAVAEPALVDDATAAGANPFRAMLDPRLWLESGSGRTLPLLVALVAIWIYFQIASGGLFLTPGNVSNLLIYASLYAIAAIGIIVVLLLGEIDLSVGSLVGLAGCCAICTMAENVNLGFGPISINIDYVPTAPWLPKMLIGIAVAIVVGIAGGAFSGFWVAVMKIPSFVVTLAGLLGYYGLSLLVTNTQTIEITDDQFNALGASSYSVWNRGYLGTFIGSSDNIIHLSAGMIIGFAGGIAYTAFLFASARSRRRTGLVSRGPLPLLLQGIGMTVIAVALAILLDKSQGLPIPVFIMLSMLIIFAYIAKRTRFGRHIYATGGNPEAARRSGISIRKVRWSAFVISGLCAGIAGIVFFANNNGGSGGEPNSNFLLLVIASAVIGGTSLVGGRGSIWNALTGSLILASVQSGMGITLGSNSNSEYYEYVVEAGILLFAVLIDTYAKNRSTVRAS